MTIEQEALRADFRAAMTATTPDYTVGSEAGGRVGSVIPQTAGHEERKVRASDSTGHSTDKLPDEHRKGPNLSVWIVSSCTSLCTVVLLGVLAYWRLA